MALDLTFPIPMFIAGVVIFCSNPWQLMSTLLEYELQYYDLQSNQYITLEYVTEPTRTLNYPLPIESSWAQTFFSDRAHFIHQLNFTILTNTIRLLVHNTTLGGDPDQISLKSQYGSMPDFVNYSINIRELEVYQPFNSETYNLEIKFIDSDGSLINDLIFIELIATHQQNFIVQTSSGSYTFESLDNNDIYTIIPKSNGMLTSFLPSSYTLNSLGTNRVITFKHQNFYQKKNMKLHQEQHVFESNIPSPIVGLVSPFYQSNINEGDTITLIAEAIDLNGGEIISVEFFMDNSPNNLIYLTSPPYQYNLKSDGNFHIFYAVATNNFNLTTSSFPVIINPNAMSKASFFNFNYYSLLLVLLLLIF